MQQKSLIKLATILLAVGAIGAAAIFGLKGSEHTVYVEQEQIQAAIDGKLPYKKPFKLIFELTVRNTKVNLTEGSERIGATTDVELNVKLGEKLKNLGGTVGAEASIRYDQEKFCFYIVEPEITDVKIQGVPEEYTDRAAAGTKPILQSYLSDVRVYEIRDNNLKLKLAKAVLKDVKVVDGKLALTLGY